MTNLQREMPSQGLLELSTMSNRSTSCAITSDLSPRCESRLRRALEVVRPLLHS